MSNILALCKILEVSPNDLLGFNDQIVSAETFAGTDTYAKTVGMKRSAPIIAVIAVAILLLGFSVGWIISQNKYDGCDTSEPAGKDLPLAIELIDMSLLECGTSENTFKITFSSDTYPKDAEYSLTLSYNSESVEPQTFEATLSNGVCSGIVTVPSPYYGSLSITANIEADERLWSKGLVKITEVDGSSYNWKAL